MENVDTVWPRLSQIPPRHTVALLVFDGIGAFHLAGPLLVFSSNGVDDAPVNLLNCAVEPKMFRTTSGSEINVLCGLEAMAKADAIIVPGWFGVDVPVPEALQLALRRADARGAQILGSCLGSFVLAEAGLLDGKRATTSAWRAHVFVERYPRVRFDRDATHVRHGNVWTSPGGAAAVQLCLQLLQALEGRAVAERAAAQLAGGPLLPSESVAPTAQTSAERDQNERLQRLLNRMLDHLDTPETLASLAASVHMTVRTFTRRFRRLTGTTVLQWRLHQQLQRARELLEASDRPLKLIAEESGFGSAITLRKHFAQAFGTSPSKYRSAVRLQPPL